jgi:hypothetical protein
MTRHDDLESMETSMSDAWHKHLAQFGLLEIEEMAQAVYYRVRVANDWQFDLEYTGGLVNWNHPRLLAFEQNEAGKGAARTFLAEMRQTLAVLYGLSDE